MWGAYLVVSAESSSDQYGDNKQTCKLPITGEDYQEVPLSLPLKCKPAKLLTCHEGKHTLSSSDPQAKGLGYTLQSLTTASGQGTFWAEDGVTPLQAGDRVVLGPQTRVLKPSREVVAEEAEQIKRVVSNEQGDLSAVQAACKLAKATYEVSAQATAVHAQARGRAMFLEQ